MLLRVWQTQGERPFAEIKQTMGLRRFQLRGPGRVCAEWDLVSAASNVLRHDVGRRAGPSPGGASGAESLQRFASQHAESEATEGEGPALRLGGTA
jgi:hypothetical protein